MLSCLATGYNNRETAGPAMDGCPTVRGTVLFASEERREIDVPGKHGRLRCVVQGRGEPVVLLHGGLGTGATHFRSQIPEFAATHMVITPDFLGYGGSEARPVFDQHFYERDVEDVVSLIGHLQLPPVHLCGFSDGAVVAMKLAGGHGALVRSLVLIGAQAEFDEPSMEETRKLAPADSLPEGLQHALARAHGDPYWRYLVSAYVEAWESLYAEGGDLATASLGNITCPTLIVQGELDPWVVSQHAHTIHQAIKGSELEIFPGAGHEVHREQPQAFNRLMRTFLAALSGDCCLTVEARHWLPSLENLQESDKLGPW